MHLALTALAGRITLLGVERIVVKQLGLNGDSVSATFLFFALGALPLLPFALALGVLDIGLVPTACLSSLFYAVAFVCYVHALRLGEASLVSPLYNFNIFFLALLAGVFLGEPVTGVKIGALILLVYGASFLNRQHTIWASLRALACDRACRVMIAGSMLIAVGRVIDTAAIHTASPLGYAFVLYACISLYILVYILWRGEWMNVVGLFRRSPGLSALSGAINGFSYLFLLLALTQIEVSVAEPVSMLGMVVTLFLARWIFKEDIKDRMIGVAIMLVAAWLLLAA
ncbi:EamA family transporter [Desulfohalobium retbaense]|uniref:EamA domain-containing protein n=1 Tax=Desulfohalobium retbaense (strain ATCC 49708 / DSM 5692 / JCM 16813 / HR100) TaxID=485915 RepID=C8X255_DESRD|nr:EamA family transporter [Desulfohalobium retbaense]ACV68378.1 protein of unknown function DUF6 transmembrane [Desulfohalobium retbaense DSM 5692]